VKVRRTHDNVNISIHGTQLKQVMEFMHLGSIFPEDAMNVSMEKLWLENIMSATSFFPLFNIHTSPLRPKPNSSIISSFPP
jgi:hypothetical protein